MENEDKRRIHHPPGHEHHGIHVCHKCGWTFPNPHPSAKHRRAHKKVCGKNAGSKITGSEEKSHSDSDSDEALTHSESTAGGSGEKVGRTVAGGSSRSEDEVFADAVTEFSDAELRHTEERVVISETISQPNDSIHTDQIMNLNALESKPALLGSDLPSKDHALHSISDATGASSEKKTNTAVEQTQGSCSGNLLLSSFSKHIAPRNYSIQNSNLSHNEYGISSVPVVATDEEGQGNGESTEDKTLPTTAILPTGEVEFSSETNVSTPITRDDSFKDSVMHFNAPDLTILDTHEKKFSVSGQQKDQSEKSPSIQSDLVEVEAGEHLGASVDTLQVPYASLQSDSWAELHETRAENLPVFSVLEVISARNYTETQSDMQDHMVPNPEVTQTLTNLEEMESNSRWSDPVLEDSHSGPISIMSDVNSDVFPTTVQAQEINLQVDEHDDRSMSKNLIVDQSGEAEDLNEETSQNSGIGSSECVAKDSNGLGSHLDYTKAFTPDDQFIGSSEVVATKSQSEDNKPGSFLGEEEPYNGFSHGIVHASVVGGYGDTGAEDGNSLSSTHKVSENTVHVTEIIPQMHETAGMDKLEGNLQLTEATEVFTVVGSRETDIDRSFLQSISDNEQNCLDKVDQESSIEHAPGGPAILPIGPESFVQSSFTPTNSGTNYLKDGDACEGGNIVLKQDASASVFVADPSVDSISQTDTVQGNGGSVSESIAQVSGDKVSVTVAEGAVISEEEFCDAVPEFADAVLHHKEKGVLVSDEMPPQSGPMHDGLIQNLHALEGKPELLDGCNLHSTSNPDGSTSDVKTNVVAEQTQLGSSDSLLLPSALPLETTVPSSDSIENPNFRFGEDENSSVAAIFHDTNAGDNGENTEDTILSATAILPAAEVGILSDYSTITTVDGSPKDTVMDLKVDSVVSLTQEELLNASRQQKHQSETSPSIQSGVVVDDEGKHFGASVDAHQGPEASLHGDCRTEVYGTAAENWPASSTLEVVPSVSTTDTKSDAYKNHVAVEPEVTHSLTSVEVEESISYFSGSILEGSYSGSMPIESGESADVFPTTMPVQEVNLQVDESTGRSMSNKMIVDQGVVDENVSNTASEVLGISSRQSTAKEIDFNGLGTLSDSTRAFTPVDALMGSTEVDVNKPEDNKRGSSLGEEEPHHDLSHELLQEEPTVPVTVGSNTSSSVETEVHQEIVKESGEETGTVHINVVGDYSEAGTEDGNSLSSTWVTPGSDIEMHENAGRNEVEGTLKLTEATDIFTVVGSKGIDIDISSLKSVSDNSHQQMCDNELDQESSKEHAPDSFSDPSLVKTDEEVENIGTGSGLEEKMHLIGEIGSCKGVAHNSTPEELLLVEAEPLIQSSFTPATSGNEYATHKDASEGDDTILRKDATASVAVVDASVDSISQTDSLEGNWGSVSDITVPSTRDASDAMPVSPMGTPAVIDVIAPKEASNTNSKKQNAADNSDLFEAPSFMTLVEPGGGNNRQQSTAEIQSAQNVQRPSSTSQTSWFPSLTNVVNESQGRKKNEEIIAKVVNWSPGKPHTPLRNLLVDANVEGKHTASTPAQDHRSLKSQESPGDVGALAKTAVEVSTVSVAKEVADTEWNSPARMPVIKREKRKVRAYWAPFVCCSSIN